MHITASWESAEVEVEVGEECRSLAALKRAVCSALPEGVDGEKVCLEVRGRAMEEEDVVALSEGGRVDAVPTLAACAAAKLREEGRDVDLEGFKAAARGGEVRLCGLYFDAGVVCPSSHASFLFDLAIDLENIELCTLLLERRVDVNVVSNELRWGGRDLDTPLHLAILLKNTDPYPSVYRPENTELCALLIDRGADVHRRNHRNHTPLHSAVRREGIALCTLLLDRGSDVNAKESNDLTPLHMAAALKNTALCALLLKRGSDVNAEDEMLQSPLHLAVEHSCTEVCALLLDQGANVHAKDERGDTPLHGAICESAPEMFTLLLDRGADADAKNEDDETPVDRLQKLEPSDLCFHLMDKGYGDMGREGWTPLRRAVRGLYDGLRRDWERERKNWERELKHWQERTRK